MKKSTIAILAVLAAVVLLVVGVIGWGISTNNRFVELETAVDKAGSQIQVVLKRRADLIPNLVNTVKGYAQHEEDIYTALADARAKMTANGATTEEMMEGNAELSSALSRLMVVVENYPELKASENFVALQDELAGAENRISRAREEYNRAVESYNSAIRKFPASIIAGMQGFEKRTFFEASEADMSNPQVDFSE